VGKATWEALGPDAVGVPLGPITVKGKTEAVEAWRLGPLPPSQP
jgi:class 3 adenylate cyclase